MKRKILISTLTYFFTVLFVNGQLQTSAGFVPGNRTLSASLEKNMLFNSTTRYTVTQSGVQAYTSDQLSSFFDGAMLVQYSQSAVTPSNNLVITIEGLPYYHTQVGAWVGFSTRYWPPKSFKIEGYNVWSGANTWVTLADVTSNVESQYVSQVVPGEYTKLRFTFREGAPDGVPVHTMGLSELFFIHPEAAQAYDGLLVKANGSGNVGIGTTNPNPEYKLDVAGKIQAQDEIRVTRSDINIGGSISIANPAKTEVGQASLWRIINMGGGNGNSLQFWAYDNIGCTTGGLCNSRFTITDDGKVGIGTTIPQYTLDVKGKIRGTEIRVEPVSAFPDFVFEKDYNLRDLKEVRNFISQNGHLPEIPTAEDVKENGIDVAELQIKLLLKIEELTLYVIQQQEKIEELESKFNK
ncbi:MAG: hypothetical protein Q7J05_02535 [Paludibacter sp.]|nr:hypothetical protein [Paludibacter sp.]